jgi:ABC-type multidrug transport system fused ATPase/permease subunit
MLRRTVVWLSDYLRITAMRRMFSFVDVHPSEIVVLIALAVLFAIFEGIGLALLLPILQYADGGQTAILESSGAIWRFIAWFMDTFHLPLTLPVLLLLAFIPILLRQAVFYVNTWYSAVVATRISMRLRVKTLDRVLNADPEFFARHSVGHIVGVVLSQTAVGGNAILAVIKLLSIALLLLLYVAILLALTVPLTLITLFFAIATSLALRANIRHIRHFGNVTANVTQDVYSTAVERFGMIRLVKLRDQKELESHSIIQLLDRLRLVDVRQARLGANIEVTVDPMLMLSVFVTLYVGIAVLGMTLPQLGLMLFVLQRLNVKVKEFNAGRQAISQNMGGLLLVNDLTREAETADTIHGGEVAFEGLRDRLVLSDVTFEYPDVRDSQGRLIFTGREVLNGVSLCVPAGSFTAIVGRSGVGKSTLVELIPRLRDVTGGAITFDGVPIAEFDVGSLRRGIGYLTQDPMLFNDTVRANLAYGLGRDPSEEEILSVLERAHAGFVRSLPDGLETLIGDRGVRFSGGEQQRLALARVLLEDTSILILDEPTSALDSESEAYIQDTLATLQGEKTIIVIAHRLSTVIKADQLLVIDDGRIVESGTHEELVNRPGAYRQLFSSQLLRA